MPISAVVSIDDPMSLVGPLLAGMALLALALAAFRSPPATVVLLLVIWIPSVALRDSVDLSFTVDTFQVFAADAFAVVLVGVAVTRFVTDGIRDVGRGLAFALLLLLAVHVVRGLGASDLETGLNDSRGWLYFTATLCYAATVPGGWELRPWRILAAAGVLLAAIGTGYILAEGLGSATTEIARGGEIVTSRPVTAAGTLLILQAAILAASMRWPGRRSGLAVAAAMVAVVVVLQHRTVWVAAVLVAGAAMFWWASSQPKRRAASVFAATGLVLLLTPVMVWGFSQSGTLIESVGETTSSDSTFAWRTTGWAELIESHDSAVEVVAGAPSSEVFKRTTDRGVTDVSPHNEFVEAYIRFGLVGLSVVLWLGLMLWFRRGAGGRRSGLGPHAVGLLLLAQLAFSGAYSLDAVQGLIAGILISSLAMQAPARGPSLHESDAPRSGYRYRTA